VSAYTLYHLLGILACLCFSFFFSFTETALFSLSGFQVKKIQRMYKGRGALVARLLAHPARLLTSILIGNMFVNILSSLLGESLLRRILGNEGTFLAIVGMTFAILVMGEVTPKTIAIQRNVRFAPIVAPLIASIGALLAPVRHVVRAVSDRIVFFISRGISPSDHAVTEEEIKTALAIGAREGVVDAQEREMIQGVFDFADRRVARIMRPRREIVMFDVRSPLARIEEAIRVGELSRIPIYEGAVDHVIGILHAKDLLRALDASPEPDLKSLLRPALFVPESKTAASLLREFKRTRTHLAVVVDEYGSVSGLVTLEDLLEEIIGEIRDKGDAVPLFERLDAHRYRVRGRMEIPEFNRLFGCAIEDDASTTIGGFIVNKLGRIPPAGYRLRHGDLTLTVSSAERTRVREIIVEREGPP